MPETPTLIQIQQFVQARYGNRAGRLTVLGAGEWSRAYAFTLDGAEAVVRFGAHGDDFAKDQIMAGFASATLPIPRVIELGQTPWGHFVVSERAHGVLLDDLDGDGVSAVLPSLLKALDAMKGIDLLGAEGHGLWRPDRTAPHGSWRDALLAVGTDTPGTRTHGWRAALAGSPTGVGPFDIAYKELARLSERVPDWRQLIHGDLLYHNVLVDGSRLTAVVDWGNSLLGDHLYDAAWLQYWWPWYPAWSGIDIRAELEQHWSGQDGLPVDLDDRLRCYQIHIGLAAQAYNAFTGRLDHLDANARQTLVLCQGGRGDHR